jgi:hypothetical protein
MAAYPTIGPQPISTARPESSLLLPVGLNCTTRQFDFTQIVFDGEFSSILAAHSGRLLDHPIRSRQHIRRDREADLLSLVDNAGLC